MAESQSQRSGDQKTESVIPKDAESQTTSPDSADGTDGASGEVAELLDPEALDGGGNGFGEAILTPVRVHPHCGGLPKAKSRRLTRNCGRPTIKPLIETPSYWVNGKAGRYASHGTRKDGSC